MQWQMPETWDLFAKYDFKLFLKKLPWQFTSVIFPAPVCTDTCLEEGWRNNLLVADLNG